MKNNRLAYLLILILAVWLLILSNSVNDINSHNDENVINEYNVTGFSTDFTKIVNEDKAAVVTVNTDVGVLSGFVYKQDEEGVYILTAYHGVAESENLSVTFGTSYTVEAQLFGYDLYTDLAVLKIITPYTINGLWFADASLLKTGEFVIMIGTPVSADYASSVEMAMVSAKDVVIENNISVDEERHSYFLDVIQLSSRLLNGYSGSPLINMNGEVVGMNTMAYSDNFTFAVNGNEIRMLADMIISGQEIKRNNIGIKGSYIQDMYNYEKNNLNINIDTINGIYVLRVKENTLAFAAGIRPGDVVTAINGKEINDLNDYLSVLYSDSPEFVFDYIRNSEHLSSNAAND